jgi:hypothetical protein
LFDVDYVINDALKISAKERCDGWWSWHQLTNGGWMALFSAIGERLFDKT